MNDASSESRTMHSFCSPLGISVNFSSRRSWLVLIAAVVCLTPQCSFAQTSKIKTTMTLDLLDRVTVSASVDGVIKTISGRIGSPVLKDKLLVQLDTDRRTLELKAKKNEHQALKIKSENDSRAKTGEVREASARFNLKKLREVNYRVRVPALEIARAESQVKEATQERLGARQEMSQFEFEARASYDEGQLLKFDLAKSSIQSQYDGIISRVEKRVGEFVEAGQPIVEVYRMDRLMGVVLINQEQLPPESAIGVGGKLSIEHDGETLTRDISIVRILPRLDIDGKYRAFVEMDNEKSPAGNWLLLPGMVGKATFTPKSNTTQKRK